MCADFGDGKIEEIVTDKFITQVTIAFSRIVGKRFLADKLSPATVDYVLMKMVSGLPFEIKASHDEDYGACATDNKLRT